MAGRSFGPSSAIRLDGRIARSLTLGVRRMHRPRDVDRVIEQLRRAHPGLQVEQLRVAHPGDDDGLWFFTHPHGHGEIQLESPTGNLPFLVEGTDSSARDIAASIEDAVSFVVRRLRLETRTV